MQKSKQIRNIFYLSILFIVYSCNETTFYSNNLGLEFSSIKLEYEFIEPSSESEEFHFKVLHYNNDKSEVKLRPEFPKLDESRKNWKIFNWAKTLSYNEYKFLEILYSYQTTDSKLQIKIEELKKTLKSEGNFYCYYFKKDGDLIYAIDFYLIDIKTNSLYNILIRT